jgi:serine/threonine protein kinase
VLALVERGWLTAYQGKLLLLGRGGELVLGAYTILDRLGEGGNGQVFKARHRAMNRLVALKLLRPDAVSDAEAAAANASTQAVRSIGVSPVFQ